MPSAYRYLYRSKLADLNHKVNFPKVIVFISQKCRHSPLKFHIELRNVFKMNEKVLVPFKHHKPDKLFVHEY